MVEKSEVTAAVLIIGNEVLSGRTRDANLQFLATELGALGVRMREARVVPDDEDAIVAALNALRGRYDYVFTTGGIGPTHDDITSAAVAKAFGVPLERNPEALECLNRQYRPGDLNAARLRMADIPSGATLIANPVSNAPGYRIDNVFVLAGVPRIAQAMFDSIRHTLRGGAKMHARTMTIFIVEGMLAEGLATIQAAHDAVEIGSYPFIRDQRLGAAIVVRGTDEAKVDAAARAVAALARELGAEPEEEKGGDAN